MMTMNEVRERMGRMTIGIAGLGGLGSAVALTLARTGAGQLIIVDFDRVDDTNILRQQYHLAQIGMLKTEAMRELLQAVAPRTVISVHTVRLDPQNIPEIFDEAQYIAECLDAPTAKAMFTHTVLAELVPRGAKLVAASGLAGSGPANDIATRALKPGFSLVGDSVSDVDAIGVMLASRVGITASHQAHQIIRWVLEDTATG